MDRLAKHPYHENIGAFLKEPGLGISSVSAPPRSFRRALPAWAHLAIFALSIVLPLWCLIGLIALKTVDLAREDYQQQVRVVARNIALELDRELAGIGGILLTLATSPSLQLGDFRRFHEHALQVAPSGSVIVMRDRSGQPIISTLFPFGTPLPVTTASAVQAADECVFRTRSACVSDLYTGTTDRQPYVLLNAPVFRNGEVEFALNVAVRAQHLASLLSRNQWPAGWAVAINDRQHRIVARWPEHDRFVGGFANPALRQEDAAGEGVVRTVNVAGVPVWGYYVRLPSWGWRVAIGVPEALLSAPARRSAYYLIWAGLLAIGLSLAAAIFSGRRLARSIQMLNRMAAEIDVKHTSPRPSTSIRELDEVSASLAEASSRLRVSIEDRDRAQSELRRLNDELRARVEAEVAAREEVRRQLAHAQRMEALGQLAGGIAHDFNNVLQVVHGGTKLIERDPTNAARVLRLTSMVTDAASRGAAVTRRLLTFARQADLRAEPVDPGELLATMHEILQHTLGSGVEVRVELKPGLPALLADRGQLETVLVNLAANGRDAMGGAGVLTLSAVDETVPDDGSAVLPAPIKPGAYVRLSIADTGEGMDEATLARASEPFFTTKPPGQGTGLGLAMARGFVEQSGGAMQIESALGVGTTVRLWLPVAGNKVRIGGPALAELHPTAAAGRRILFVDDEVFIRAITGEGLEAAGFVVHSFGSGAEALGFLDAGNAVDLIITDLAMPGMDGLALIRGARQRRPGLPAILVTGFATDTAELAAGGTIDGPFALLRKPIDVGYLAERAAALLQAPGTSSLGSAGP